MAAGGKRSILLLQPSTKEQAYTYWYIEAVPELLELASKRVEEVQP